MSDDPPPEQLNASERAELNRYRASAVPEPDSGDAGAASLDQPIALLTSFAKATLFSDLFKVWAVRRCDGKTTQARVAALALLHPHYYDWCRWADYFARGFVFLAITVIVIAAAVGLVLQTFFPGWVPGQ